MAVGAAMRPPYCGILLVLLLLLLLLLLLVLLLLLLLLLGALCTVEVLRLEVRLPYSGPYLEGMEPILQIQT